MLLRERLRRRCNKSSRFGKRYIKLHSGLDANPFILLIKHTRSLIGFRKGQGMTKKRPPNRENRIWVAAVLDCQGAITLQPFGTNLGLGLTVTAKNSAIPNRVCKICGGRTRNIRTPGNSSKHMRWNVFGRKARELLEQIEPNLFVSKKAHIRILHHLFNELENPKQMNSGKVRRYLILFNKLSQRGYPATQWPKRVDRFIAAVTDSGRCTF